MNKYYRRSYVTGKFKPSPKPSEFRMNVFIMCFIALAVLAINYRSLSLRLMEMTVSAASAETQEVEESWTVNGQPCTETETDVTCILSETTHVVPPPKPVVKSVAKAKPVAGKIPQKYWDLAIKICDEQKQDKVECPRYLLAVAMVESVFGTKMVGDGGLSQGWFHIYHIHNKTVSLECKMDFYCSGSWSLKRMIGNGYSNPKTREWAVASHNSVTPKQNAVYLKMVKDALKRIE